MMRKNSPPDPHASDFEVFDYGDPVAHDLMKAEVIRRIELSFAKFRGGRQLCGVDSHDIAQNVLSNAWVENARISAQQLRDRVFARAWRSARDQDQKYRRRVGLVRGAIGFGVALVTGVITVASKKVWQVTVEQTVAQQVKPLQAEVGALRQLVSAHDAENERQNEELRLLRGHLSVRGMVRPKFLRPVIEEICQLERAKGSVPMLSFAQLRDAKLDHLDLTEVDLKQADLRFADLTESDLSHANLSAANLEGAILEGAKLDDVDLRSAVLTRGNLSRASLIGANLTGVDLSGANLEGANLTDANLTNANLTGARLKNAILPDGADSR